MSKAEQYQWKVAMMHIEQANYHKKVANILLDGIIDKYYKEDKVQAYNREVSNVLAQALN